MFFRQHKTGFKKNIWEKEELNSKEYKQARCSRSGHLMAHTVYMGLPRWTDKVAEFYSYNDAIGVDGGYRRDQMSQKCLDKGCDSNEVGSNYGKVEKKDSHKIFVFGAVAGGHEKTINVHGQKRRVFGNSVNHGYSSCSESDSESDSD